MPVLPSFEQLKNKLITKNQDSEIVVSQTESNEKEEIGKNVLLKDSSINQWLQEYASQRKAEDKMLEFMIFHERLFEIKDNVLSFVNKYRAFGTVDFIQNIDQNILVISSSQNKELQFFDKKLNLLKNIDLPFRVNTYNCFENTFLFAGFINNKPNILWLK